MSDSKICSKVKHKEEYTARIKSDGIDRKKIRNKLETINLKHV